MSRGRGSRPTQRLAALVLAIIGIPVVLTADAALRDAPIVAGRPSPRTVVAPAPIRVVDAEATAVAREEAAAALPPVLVSDDEAPAAIVREVREAFAAARSVRAAGGAPETQVTAMAGRMNELEEAGLRRLVALSDEELNQVAAEAVDIAQLYARETVSEARVDDVADRLLHIELAVRPLPQGVGVAVVEPVLRAALRPTVREDVPATGAARERAAASVAEVAATWSPGETVVAEGERVGDLALAALRSRDLQGSTPWRTLAAGFAVALLLTGLSVLHLRGHEPEVWASGRRVLLFACLLTVSAVTLEAASLPGGAWAFAAPLGALAMLAAILLGGGVGVLAAVVQAALAALVLPGEPGVVLFVLVAGIGSVALVTGVSSRAQLRRVALRSTLGYGVVAALCAAIFRPEGPVLWVAVAGLVGGVVGAVLVNGSLPFLESTFGLCTATGLLDLADRNHPLLRELEQSALGSYSHSIVVSTMVERAARAIGANALLGSVAALYHDIGKVRRPAFFVENQFGIANPHDTLTPEASADIIRAHVRDGVVLARAHHLPPEVIEGIASHHGTTLVSFFHRVALAAAGPGERVDAEAFRYPGPKPSSRETAVLMLADVCEGAARALAQAQRDLSGADLEALVARMVGERLADGQLDESPLTLRDLSAVQRSFTETLTGVYHPRISYPPVPVAPALEVTRRTA